MKRILFFASLFSTIVAKSQNIIVQNGASFIAAGTPTIVLNNMGLDAAANTTDWQAANLLVSGNAACLLKNASTFIKLQKLTVDKPGAKLAIANDVQVAKSVEMVNGLFDLSGKNLFLLSNAVITGESETTRITGATGGYIQTTANLSNANNFNPGNLGVYITTAANAGSVTITRGHKAQTGSGLSSGINRYYDFNPANTALNATLTFTYFDAELTGQIEAGLQLMESANGGSSWINKPAQSKSAATNYVTANGLKSLHRYTLGGAAGAVLPVIVLELNAKRLNAQQVQLKWTTAQETASKGFAVERKRESDAAFVQTGFVASKAPGGNSTIPLTYEIIDTNNFNGKAIYRLKQLDNSGAFVYSAMRVADGSGAVASLMAWPQPAIGSVHLSVQGIEKDELQVWNAGGQLVKQQSITNGESCTLQLSAGSYIVRVKSHPDLVRKVVVQ